ncbi:MAG: hypothetical protein R3E86_15645 [Pseudomonadales bacterium]
MPADKPLTPRSRLVFGALFVAFGVFPMLAAFDIGPLGTEDINGPAWLGFAAGGVFAAGGLAVIAGRSPLASLFTLLVLAGFVAIANWIAFGVGERVCGVSILGFAFSSSGDLSGLGCRVPFGLAALMVNGVFGLAAVSSLQKLLGGPPRLARTLKVAEWALLLVLAPVLVPLLGVLVIRSAADALKTRLTTGAWPRNEAFIRRQATRKHSGQPVR